MISINVFFFSKIIIYYHVPKFTFRHLRQGIQEFRRKYVLVPADKAAENIDFAWRLHYINTLKQELRCTNAYLEISEEEKSVVFGHRTI